ncbi:hypothetical protein KP509_30G008500 [Ceratopteris richardii]|uniref:CREG-like beta-barrel domain-containing protein n=1 Tax=Ceratopteris richardii TaxID=49495 RepID=A0A8T2QZI1_CERRI|nr:hypothetical protein KP509_30G008500 [Ceratopteris richardii]
MVKHYALPMWAMILVILWVTTTAAEKTRPDPNDPHRMARWLVASSYWAVISTTSIHLKGAPWGNVADVSDGDPINSTGVPYFYLTSLDPTPQDLAANPNCSVTFSEDALGTCAEFDAEDPRCAKLTLYGQMEAIQPGNIGFDFAKNALFTKHPQMKGWPDDHKFNVYKLNIEDIFLVDYFGGPKKLNVTEYFQKV